MATERAATDGVDLFGGATGLPDFTGLRAGCGLPGFLLMRFLAT